MMLLTGTLNSPVFRADRVETPLLMIHNDEDDAVPWYQGIEYYLALRRLGKEVLHVSRGRQGVITESVAVSRARQAHRV